MIWFTSGTQPPQAVPARGAAFQRAMSQAPPATASRNGALADRVAGADLGRGRQRVDAEAGARRPRLRQDQEFGRAGSFEAVQHHLQQRAVFRGVADQHRAQQALAAIGHDDLFVDALALVAELEAAAAGRIRRGRRRSRPRPRPSVSAWCSCRRRRSRLLAQQWRATVRAMS
jgi:hypothetical protein